MSDGAIIGLCSGLFLCLTITIIFFEAKRMSRAWNNDISSLLNTENINGNIGKNDILLQGCFKLRGGGSLSFHHRGSVVCVLNTNKLRLFIAKHEPYKTPQWEKLVYTPSDVIKITAKKVSDMLGNIKIIIHSKTHIPDILFLKTIEKGKQIEPIIEILNAFAVS